LSTTEGIGSGVGRSTSQSGGRWRGWSGQGGTPWRCEARVGVEGVWERSKESNAGEVLIAAADSAVGFGSWCLLVEQAPRDMAGSAWRGGAPGRWCSMACRCTGGMGWL
jgi:hypothetical protein